MNQVTEIRTSTETLSGIIRIYNGYIVSNSDARKELITKMSQLHTNSSNIEKLIRLDAELKVWTNYVSIIENVRRQMPDNDDAVLEQVKTTVTRVALQDHFVNSSSDIQIEIELRERQAWAIIANQLNGF